ncbi:MAG TPA: DMT family transporter [Selenomonadales bacterium]|nr:DMT family transporter [Selenomonadales bacterium]
MKPSQPLFLYCALISVAFLWGTSFAAAKLGLRELSPLNLAMLRFLIASTVFGGILLALKDHNTIERQDIPRFFLLGFLAITSYFYIQYTGLTYTTTINAALIIATSPICAALLGAFLGWEHFSLLNGLGILTAFSGVGFIITNGHFTALFQPGTLTGNLLLQSNAVVWAGVTVYGKKLLAKYRPFVAMAYIHIFGTLLLVPFIFFPGPFAAVPLAREISAVTWLTVASSLHLALLCSVFSYFIWYLGVEKLGAVRTASFAYLNPLFAVIAGVLFLGETFTAFTALGGAMIIAGVYITNRARTPKQPVSQ